MASPMKYAGSSDGSGAGAAGGGTGGGFGGSGGAGSACASSRPDRIAGSPYVRPNTIAPILPRMTSKIESTGRTPGDSAARVVLRRGRARRLWFGHPWVYGNAVDRLEGQA